MPPVFDWWLFTIDFGELREFVRNNWQLAKVNKINSRIFWKRVAEYINYDQDKLRKELIEYHGINPNVLELVKSLKSTYKLALLSNHIEDWLEEEIEKRKLEEIFDVIVTSYETGFMKPEPKIYQITIDKLELRPGECLFIDDKERNTRGAEELGIKTILFENLQQLKGELQKLGIKVD